MITVITILVASIFIAAAYIKGYSDGWDAIQGEYELFEDELSDDQEIR